MQVYLLKKMNEFYENLKPRFSKSTPLKANKAELYPAILF